MGILTKSTKKCNPILDNIARTFINSTEEIKEYRQKIIDNDKHNLLLIFLINIMRQADIQSFTINDPRGDKRSILCINNIPVPSIRNETDLNNDKFRNIFFEN